MPAQDNKSSDSRVALIGYGLGGQSFHAPVITAELDLGQIREVRNVWQFYRDRRPETHEGLVKS